MTARSRLGGLFSIISGGLGLAYIILLAVLVLRSEHRPGYSVIWATTGPTLVASLIMAALALVGGTFAIRRQRWAWALAGAVCAGLLFFPCGIPAILYTIRSKPEFTASGPGITPRPTRTDRFPSLLGYLGAILFTIVSVVNFAMLSIGDPPPGYSGTFDGLGYMLFGALIFGFVAMILALAGLASRSSVLGIVLIAAGGLYSLSFGALILKNAIMDQLLYIAMAVAIAVAPGIVSIVEGIALRRRKRQTN